MSEETLAGGRRRMTQEERRAQLVTKAREAFLEGGYRGTTTKYVAQSAGVSEALVVKHFGSKEELFRHAMVDPLLEILRDAVRQPVPVGPSIIQQREDLHSFLLRWAKVVREQGPLFWAVLREAQDFPEIGEIALLFRSHVEAVANRLTITTQRSEYRPFDTWVAACLGLAAGTAAGMVGGDMDAFVAQVVDIIYEGVLSGEGRRVLSAAAGSEGSGT